MGVRALSILLFLAVLVLVPLGWITAQASKTVFTDVITETPYGDYQSVVLRRSKFLEQKFNESHGGEARRSCVSWWSSQPIEVYFQVTRMDTGFDGVKWHKHGVDPDWFWTGWGSYRYRFVRVTDDPVQIVFTLTGSTKHCGDRGSTTVLPQPLTPIDVFTDLLGMRRLPTVFDNPQYVSVGEVARPSTAMTPRTQAEHNLPKSVTLFEPLIPKSRTNQRQPKPLKPPPEITSLAPKPLKYWKRIVRSQNDPSSISLRNEDWMHVEKRMAELDMWDGSQLGSIRNWQKFIGDRATGVLNARQLDILMDGGRLNALLAEKAAQERQQNIERQKQPTAPQAKPNKQEQTASLPIEPPKQTLSLTKEQWRKVQRRLNQLGFEAGRANGVIAGDSVLAIMKFEQSINRKQDGVLSLQEYRKLMP